MVKELRGNDLAPEALQLTAADMAHSLLDDLAYVYSANTVPFHHEYVARLAQIGLKRAIHAEGKLKGLREQLEAAEAENRLLREEIQ